MALPEAKNFGNSVMDDGHERLFLLQCSVLIMAACDQA